MQVINLSNPLLILAMSHHAEDVMYYVKRLEMMFGVDVVLNGKVVFLDGSTELVSCLPQIVQIHHHL